MTPGERADFDADTLAGIVQDVLEEHMSLGTSGRYLTNYKVSPYDLAEKIATRVFPHAAPICEDCGDPMPDGPSCDHDGHAYCASCLCPECRAEARRDADYDYERGDR